MTICVQQQAAGLFMSKSVAVVFRLQLSIPWNAVLCLSAYTLLITFTL